MVLPEGRPRTKRLHTHESKLQGVSRRRGMKRKLFVIPKICQVFNGLISSKHSSLHSVHSLGKIIRQKFCCFSMNSTTKPLITVPIPFPSPILLYLLQNFSPTTSSLSHYAVEKLWASSGTRSSSSAAALTRCWTWLIKLCQTWATRVSQHTDPQCSCLSESLLVQAKCQTLADLWVCGLQSFKVWEHIRLFHVFH